MNRYILTAILAITSLFLLTGCMNEIILPGNGLSSVITNISSNDQDPLTGSNTKGNLKVYLTNSSEGYKKPPDFVGGLPEGNEPPNLEEQYLEVNICISRIEVHIASDEEEVKDGYWAILKEWDPGYSINLMDLQNTSVLLASLDMESNTYTQLRIFLTEKAELVLLRDEREVTESLEIPSSALTGIKLNHPFEIVAGNITKLTIDFNASKSVVKLGNGKYLMKPVIGLSSETYSTSDDDLTGLTGSVSGNVSYYDSTNLALTGIEGAEIKLIGGSYLFENTTSTLADGSFILFNVPTDIYTIHVHTESYDDFSASIEVKVGENTKIDVVFLIQEPGGISGLVLDNGTGSPIQGATVTATLAGGSTYNFIISTETDISGSFLLEQLPIGTYVLIVEAFGYIDSFPITILVTPGVITNSIYISMIEDNNP